VTLILPRNSEDIVGVPSHPLDANQKAAGKSSHLAHDARNCLTVLRIYCDLLRASGAIRSGYEQWLEELAGAVERGQQLMDSLLDSIAASRATDLRRENPDFDLDPNAASCEPYRAERPHILTPGAFEIAAALRRRLPILERMAGDNIQVEVHAAAHAGTVQISESDFERILYNLAGNAIEAMPQGGTLRISLRAEETFKTASDGPREARRSAETVSLCVADTGTGIDPNRLPRIFETGISRKRKHADRPERHGFGLAIVRELTERAGGDVRVYSQPGCGSRFEVELPAA
jgi:signal transduction histidine kinase